MKKVLLIIAAIIVPFGVVSLAGAYAYSLLQPVDLKGRAPTVPFVIPKGQAVATIARRLQQEKLIRSALAFRLAVKYYGLESKIQAGSFQVSPSWTPRKIAETLTSGSNDLWVTIPEGWRREELADSLVKQELPNFDKEKFLELSATSEGKLFPDTYLVPRDATAESIFNLLTDTFEKKVVQGLAKEIAASERSLDEALTMASLIEREAFGADEMPTIAGILWNRIDINMALQVDATLQYAKGYDKTQQSWWVPPLGADRQLNSPFNTYQQPGLPPRPIASPGLQAIKAALKPAETEYLFYIHDRQGKVHYAKTLDQHNQNIDKYLR